MTDLTIWTPVEIDTELAKLYRNESRALQYLLMESERIEHAVRKQLGRGYRAKVTHAEVEAEVEAALATTETTLAQDEIRAAVSRRATLRAELDAIREQAAPYNAEFVRRGGWTRAFLVTNNNGHVHSSMECSTCFPTTRYYWVTDLSGHNETEIVEKSGSDACTVCYPSAPVEALARPRSFFTPDEEEKQAEKAYRALSKEEKKALQIKVKIYYYGDKVSTQTFKHERELIAALNRELLHSLRNEREIGDEAEESSSSYMTLMRDRQAKYDYNVEAFLGALRERGIEFPYEDRVNEINAALDAEGRDEE